MFQEVFKLKFKMNGKILIICSLAVALCFVSTSASPVIYEEELVGGNGEAIIELYEPLAVEDGLRGPRYRRATCDLFSATINGFKVNHSACAAKCLVKGYKGGSCHDGVCNCRS